MSTPVEDFAPYRILQGFDHALAQIDPVNGYNTRPSMSEDINKLFDVPWGNLPSLIIVPGDMEPDNEGRATGKERYWWDIRVLGVLDAGGDWRSDTLALVSDILGSVWGDERLIGDRALMFRAGPIYADVVKIDSKAVCFIEVDFQTLVSLNRSANP